MSELNELLNKRHKKEHTFSIMTMKRNAVSYGLLYRLSMYKF